MKHSARCFNTFLLWIEGLKIDTKKVHNDGTNGFNPTAKVLWFTRYDCKIYCSLFPPNFIFSSEYVTKPIETALILDLYQSSDSGSNIFTVSFRALLTMMRTEILMTFRIKVQHIGIKLTLKKDYASEPTNILSYKHSQSIRLQIQNDGDVVSKGNLTTLELLSYRYQTKEKEHIYQISESLDQNI